MCIMQMDIGLDTGNVVSEHRYAIQPTDTANEVHDALMNLGAEAIVADLQQLKTEGRLKSVKQPEEGITYAQKLSKEEARIDWNESAAVIERNPGRNRDLRPETTAGCYAAVIPGDRPTVLVVSR